MEQVKSMLVATKEFIFTHKAISILIGCIILFDTNLVSVITDLQTMKDQQKIQHEQRTSVITPVHSPTPTIPSSQ